MHGNSLILSRRRLFTLAGAALVSDRLYASPEFWNKKDAADWTGEEIDQLTSKSPWAKPVTAQYAPGENPGYGQGNPNGGGYPRGGGMGGPGIGIGGIGIGFPRGRTGGGRPGSGGGNLSNYKGTVRWESAEPIRAALKDPLPDGFAGHYVIAVRDIPLLGGREPDSDSNSGPNVDNLRQSATLQPKGKELVEAKVVQRAEHTSSHFLFGFSREGLDFGKKDHELDFQVRLGRLLVKAKFDPSEMLYHGQLAV